MRNYIKEVYDRFDAYDFFALWGGGIIVLTYSFCITFLLLRNKLFYVVGFGQQFTTFLSENAVSAFVFISIIAYLLGLILHELGRWLFDIIGSIFCCESVCDLYEIADRKELNRADALFRSNKFARRLCKKRIQSFNDNYEKNHPDVNLDDSVSLFYMESFLKTKGITTGKRYASYGLARSIFIGSVLNDLMVIILIAKFNISVLSFSALFVIMVSLLVSITMFGRTYKSYLAYIRNLYATFYMAKIKNND